MKHKYYIIAIFFTLIASSIQLSSQETTRQWTHFRGNELKSIAEEGSYPIQWTDTTNVDWKTEIRGRSWSSPVVYGDQIWATSATRDGKEMFVVCIDYNTGKIHKEIALFQPDSVYKIHAVNSYATPTPAIEEGRVYVHFGRYGSACLDTETLDLLWERKDLTCEHRQGPGSSVFIYKEKIILHMEGTDRMRIYALDKQTGETIWVSERDDRWYQEMKEIGKKAYTTPIVILVEGREMMISNGSGVCDAMDINTGEVIWYIPQGEDSTIAMPFESEGIVYFYTSFIRPDVGEDYCDLLAVDPKGEGDNTENIIWRLSSPRLQLLTPVIYDGLIYTIDSKSNLLCIDALTGETIWKEKLKGKYHSSPVLANGNIYFNSTRGDTYIYKAGKEKKLLAQNKLDGEIWATPAFLDGAIIMRTSKYLYKIK